LFISSCFHKKNDKSHIGTLFNDVLTGHSRFVPDDCKILVPELKSAFFAKIKDDEKLNRSNTGFVLMRIVI